jgi:hypothetical protein
MRRRKNSSLPDVLSLRGCDCDTAHCMAAGKVRRRLSVTYRQMHEIDMSGFTADKLNDLEVKN